MSALCKGRIHRKGVVWHCQDCGHISTAWNTRHAPLTSKEMSLLDCIAEVFKEAQAAEAA
jgi:hypothetical protein